MRNEAIWDDESAGSGTLRSQVGLLSSLAAPCPALACDLFAHAQGERLVAQLNQTCR